MKQRFIMISLVLMTMVGSVQGQGFLKKLGNAVDKLGKETEKLSKSHDSKKSSAKAEATTSKTTSNKEKEETYGYPPDNDEATRRFLLDIDQCHTILEKCKLRYFWNHLDELEILVIDICILRLFPTLIRLADETA